MLQRGRVACLASPLPSRKKARESERVEGRESFQEMRPTVHQLCNTLLFIIQLLSMTYHFSGYKSEECFYSFASNNTLHRTLHPETAAKMFLIL